MYLAFYLNQITMASMTLKAHFSIRYKSPSNRFVKLHTHLFRHTKFFSYCSHNFGTEISEGKVKMINTCITTKILGLFMKFILRMRRGVPTTRQFHRFAPVALDSLLVSQENTVYHTYRHNMVPPNVACYYPLI